MSFFASTEFGHQKPFEIASKRFFPLVIWLGLPSVDGSYFSPQKMVKKKPQQMLRFSWWSGWESLM